MADFSALPPTLVNTTTAGDQAPPLIASLAGGGWVVVWSSPADHTVYAQRFDAAGAKLGGETLIGQADAVNAVAGVADGGFVVLLSDGGPYSPSSVLAQRVDAAGHPAGAPALVAASTDGSVPVQGAGVQPLPDGGWLVTYEHVYFPPSPIASATLAARHFDAAGAPVGGELSLAQVSGSLVTSTAVLPDGQWVSAYNQFLNYHDGLVAFATQFSAAGVAEHVTTLNPNPGTEVNPQVAVLANGNEALVWWTPDQYPSPGHLQAQLFDAAGTPLAAAFDLAGADGALGASPTAPPHVTALAGGGFLVSWEHAALVSQPAAGPATYSYDVRAQAFDAAGHASGGTVQVGPSVTLPYTSAPSLQWNVIATPDGGFVVAEEQQDGATGLDVVAQQFVPPEAPQSTPGVVLHGDNGGDLLTGTTGNDQITGGNAKDILVGLAGDDSLDGGNGVDTAVFAGPLAAYAITKTAQGYTVAGPEGADTLANIERLHFADADVAIDGHGHGGQAYRLYQATFDRAPDSGGLGFWIASLDAGLPLEQAAQFFIASPEFSAKYGALDAAAFVDQLYLNVLHRGPDVDGQAYWVGHIAQGDIGRAATLMLFSESPENQAALVGVTDHGMVYAA